MVSTSIEPKKSRKRSSNLNKNLLTRAGVRLNRKSNCKFIHIYRGGSGSGGGGGEKDEEDKKMQDALSSAIVEEKPNIKWDQVAGLHQAKANLQEAVIFPTRFPQLF